MSAKKKAKKRLPKPVPVPCECWCIVVDGEIHPGWCGDRETVFGDWKGLRAPGERIIRVRITPVAKRRKGATR